LDAAADRGFSSSVQRRLISKRRKVAEQEGRGGSLHRMLTSPADSFAVSVRFFWVHRCFGAPRVIRVGPNDEKLGTLYGGKIGRAAAMRTAQKLLHVIRVGLTG